MSYYSRATTPANGTTHDYTIPFPYLIRPHVKVYVRATSDATPVLLTQDVDYTFTSSGVIHIAGGQDIAGWLVDRVRDSGITATLVPFAGGTLTQDELATNALQLLYLTQETHDLTTLLTSGGVVIPGADRGFANTLAELRAVIPDLAGTTCVLADKLRKGVFVWRNGNYAAQVASDPLHGIYVPANTVASTSGCWERIWDGVSGRVEWFGSSPNDGSDCLPGLLACTALCQETLLGAEDYYLFATYRPPVLLPRRIRGAGRDWVGSRGNGTRIIGINGTMDVIHTGPLAYPGSINALPQGFHLQDVEVTRAAVPVISSGCVGVRVINNLYATLDNVKSSEHMYGFYYTNTVQTHVNFCEAFRSTAGSGGGSDLFRGHCIDGDGVVSSINGNASLYLFKCRTNAGGTPPAIADGLYANNKMTDLFVDYFESQGCRNGAVLIGDNTAPGAMYTNTDVRLRHCTFDGVLEAGVYCQDLNAFGNVTFLDTYIGASNGANVSGFHFKNCKGVAKVHLAEIDLLFATTGTPTGFNFEGGSGYDILGAKVSECIGFPCVGSNVVNSRFEVTAVNASVICPNPSHVFTGTCARNLYKPGVKGAANAFTAGIHLTGTGHQVSGVFGYNIDRAAVVGGNNNAVLVNGATKNTFGAGADGMEYLGVSF